MTEMPGPLFWLAKGFELFFFCLFNAMISAAEILGPLLCLVRVLESRLLVLEVLVF